jgi:hypothetical protein
MATSRRTDSRAHSADTTSHRLIHLSDGAAAPRGYAASVLRTDVPVELSRSAGTSDASTGAAVAYPDWRDAFIGVMSRDVSRRAYAFRCGAATVSGPTVPGPLDQRPDVSGHSAVPSAMPTTPDAVACELESGVTSWAAQLAQAVVSGLIARGDTRCQLKRMLEVSRQLAAPPL